MNNDIEKLLTYIQIKPKNLQLYELALTHSSFNADAKTKHHDYERLEYIGDAVLGFIVADLIFGVHPEMDQGLMSKLRSHLVQSKALANYARKINLQNYIIAGHSIDYDTISKSDKILEDVFEALIGAIYLDQGFNVIAPDLRGCGSSEGKSTMGYLESLDVYDWLTYLNSAYPNNCNEIIVHGVSLGGATTLFLSGLEVDGVSIKDKKVIGVIEDCGYTSMTGIINDLFGSLGDSELVAKVLGLLNKVDLGNLGNTLASDSLVKNLLINTIDVGLTEENFDEKQNALNSLANAEVPILIIHGNADSTVPFENSDRVYETAMNNNKIPYVQRFIAEDENHAFIIMGNKYNVYEGHVQNFIAKAEEIKAGNTVDKDSNYEQEEEQSNSVFNSIFRLFTLFKNMF